MSLSNYGSTISKPKPLEERLLTSQPLSMTSSLSGARSLAGIRIRRKDFASGVLPSEINEDEWAEITMY